ncbi:MAG: phospholipid carrier-dependent glycosyltransferase [Caldilineaceae bacterium]|jgi:hypothetical protein|nr:phospholipid carrier-dependent glycosyltransferase [Caldilineaceae bacterium]
MRARINRDLDRSDFVCAGMITLLHALLAALYITQFELTILVDNKVGNWDWFMQTLPLTALRTDLWRSLWFLHAQPPLLNLVGGILSQLFYPHPLEALHVFNVILGALLSGMFYLLAAHFSTRRWVAVLWALVLAFNPALYLFEAYVLYTVMTAFLVMATLACVLWHHQTKSPAAIYSFILALNLLILTRSIYHIILLPLALLFVWWLTDGGHRKRMMSVSILICFLSFGWYAKNYVLFDTFSASSWSGIGLWKVASRGDKLPGLQELADAGALNAMVVEQGAFAPVSNFARYGFNRQSAIAVLANDDYNNINIPAISEEYGKNALRLILHRPWAYFHTIYLGYIQFSQPAARFKHLGANAEEIPLHESLYADYLQGNRLMGRFGAFQFFLLPLSLLIYAGQFWGQLAATRWELSRVVRGDAVLFWCAVLIVYTTIVSITMEYGENDRFKFLVEYPIWLFMPVVFSRLIPVKARPTR